MRFSFPDPRAIALTVLCVATGLAQSNGIVVGRPKVFEDEALRQMLADAEAALAKLQFVDQTSVASKIGDLQGGHLTQNAFGLSVNGPALPQVQTTANAPIQNTTSGTNTGTEVDTGTAASGNTSSTKDTGSTSATTTNNGATLQTVTNRAAASPSSPQLSASSLTLPSSLSNSALSTLNEQMQLTYEIAGLRLLLEGSLSDRYIQGLSVPKKRVTLGFPISITADKDHRNYVCVWPTTRFASCITVPSALSVFARSKMGTSFDWPSILTRSFGGQVFCRVDMD